MTTGLSPTATAELVSELLAGAPSTVAADREILDASYQTGRRDHLDGFGLSGRNFPQLSPHAQQQCALSYQWVHRVQLLIANGTIKGPPKRRLIGELRRREHHLEYLLGSVFRLARRICHEQLNNRFGGNIPSRLLEDVLGEAAEMAIELARTFDPTQGPSFAVWYASHLRKRIGTMVRVLTHHMSTPDSWRRAARLLTDVEQHFEMSLGRSPTSDEVRGGFLWACHLWARSLGDETIEEINARLVKRGLARAVVDLDDIRRHVVGHVSLDAQLREDGDESFLDLTEGVDGGFEAVVERSNTQIAALTAFALDRVDSSTRHLVLTKLAGETVDDPKGVGGRFVRDLRNELCAPHAQWCALALDPDDVTSPQHTSNNMEMAPGSKTSTLSSVSGHSC